MNAEERFKRLNAYLISKGKEPKSAVPVNYIKQNITHYSKTPKNSNRADISKKPSVSNSKRRDTRSSQGATANIDSISRDLNAATKTPKRREKNAVTPHPRITSGHRKSTKPKDLTRSCPRIKLGTDSKENTTLNRMYSRTTGKNGPNRIFPLKSPKNWNTPGRLNTSLRRTVLKSTTPASTTLSNSTKKVNRNGIGIDSYKPINKWLSMKGKKTFGTGFKAVKSIQTPVASPQLESSCSTPSGQSLWQGLRVEDDLDEIALLFRNSMEDVKCCIEEGCPPDILKETLLELAERVPKVEQYASYWVTLASIEQSAGSDYEGILDVYEKAIIAKAEPTNDIKDALNDWLLKRVTYDKKVENSTLKDIPSKQSPISHVAIKKLKFTESPAFKNAATSPIVFESPTKSTLESSEMPKSPSSVVKLRMVSRSSPVFNRLKFMRALPTNTSAVITPVRRSVRIASSQYSYPVGLRDHEPCLSSVQEIFPALRHTDSKLSPTTCDVVYDPNRALEGVDDIATMLKF